jgi:hypothetical protein
MEEAEDDVLIFPDEEGLLNHIAVASTPLQLTPKQLIETGDCTSTGRRPSYTEILI